MADQLWHHALKFLDKYRLSGEETPCHIMDLYKFPDNTGILDLHKRMLAQPFMDHEVDLKILYYELIRMLVNYEREQSRDQELYEYTRSITKIEGYQDLTNRLQRLLNQRFMLDIDELNRKYVAGANTLIPGENHNDQTKYEKLEMKIEQILNDNKKLNIAVSSLSSTNHVLEKEILELKGKMKSLEKQSSISESTPTQLKESCSTDDESSYPHVPDKINVLEEDIAKVNGKMQSMISQANTLLINDATHLERIFNLESQVSEINGKLSNLENADLYLQEAHRVLTERTTLIEKYSKYIEEKVKLASNQPQSSLVDNSSARFDEILKRISDLEERKYSNQKENFTNKRTVIATDNLMSQSLFTERNNSDSNLYGNYNEILNKILKMEELLNQQAQSISDYSELFSDKYFKLLSLNSEKSKQTEIKRMITEKLSEIKREEFSVYSRISEITNLNLENNKCGSECHIFDFIEILVGMNKSLNYMLDDFVASQLILKALRSQQKNLKDQMEDHKRLMHSQNTEINKLNKKIDSTHVKEICDYERVSQKTNQLNENINLMKERIVELEKLRNINTVPSKAIEEDFTIEATHKGIRSRKSNDKKWFGLFCKSNGACCC